MLRGLTRIAGGAAVAGGAAALWRFRREIDSARARLAAGSEVAETAAGPVEYGEAGEGPPVLMIHGAGGGYDQGLLVGTESFGSAYRVVAPSRFGYLRTPVPEDSSPAAQAEAHRALLDRLGIGRCIVAGVSAGAPSAIELALRHPDRVSALILLVPRTFHPELVMGGDNSPGGRLIIRLLERGADLGFWLALRFARASLVRFVGVPPEVEAAAPAPERARVTEVLRAILPVSDRVAGLAVDGEARLAEWPLERIGAPTLIVTAEDDLFRSLPGARYSADRIPGAELKVLESGGHLMVARGAEVRETIADFLERRTKAAPAETRDSL